MVFIRSRKGLDLNLGLAKISGEKTAQRGALVGADLSPFSSLPLKVLVRTGDNVRAGEAVVEERKEPRRKIIASCSGTVKEIRRGLKRQPLSIIMEKSSQEQIALAPIEPADATREQVLERISALGLFSRIAQRPFDIPANPTFLPGAIFIKAVDKAPGALGYESITEKNAELFNKGLEALQKIVPGGIHLVCDEASSLTDFKNNTRAHCHSVEGPYPACCASLHIARIAPIQSLDNLIWTLDALTVIAIGKGVSEGKCFTERLVAIYSGDAAHLVRCAAGTLIGDLIGGETNGRIICGNPLTGIEKSVHDPLPDSCQSVFILPQDHTRQMLHFMRLKSRGYTATRTFFRAKHPHISTNQNGEERPFVDGSIYDRLTPLEIPTMPLVKAVIAEDFERAKEFGLLEVAGEDFALASFICPSKIEMIEIIAAGLKLYAKQLL